MVKIILRGKLRKKFFPTAEERKAADIELEKRATKEQAMLAELQEKEERKLTALQRRQEIAQLIRERKRLQFQQSKIGRVIRGFRTLQEKRESFVKRKTLAQRRIQAERREFSNLLKEREYSRGDDNRFYGKNAKKWGTGAYGSKHNIGGKRKKRKKKDKWVANDGFW